MLTSHVRRRERPDSEELLRSLDSSSEARLSDEVIRTLLREAELGADPAVWQQLARELIRAGRLDEAGRAIARVPDLVARGPLLDAVAPRLDALRLREVKLPTRLGGVLSLAWAPDEESLYVGDEKRVLAVSVASGAILRTFDEVRVAACSPRGDEVATGPPFTVTAFAASEARSLGSERHDDMAFGPDGDTLVGVTLGDLTSDGQVTLLSRSASGGWTKRLVDFDGRVAHLDSRRSRSTTRPRAWHARSSTSPRTSRRPPC